MRVERCQGTDDGRPRTALLEDDGREVGEVSAFLGYLAARGCSPNTLEGYAYDLSHFYRFLRGRGWGWQDFTPARSLAFMEHLRKTPSRNQRARRLSPVLVTEGAASADRPVTYLSPSTVNRAFATVSSFFDYLIFTERTPDGQNPVQKRDDPSLARVPDRRRTFLEGVARRRSTRRVARVKTILRLPRPMDLDQVHALVDSCEKLRDKAMVLLMAQGGLRPGEVLCLKLEDVQYGRRRVFVRYRNDHPKGARTKSRTERVVDLHEPEALAALSAYVMRERPADAESPFVFLVGGNGKRRMEPLGYCALVRMFARRCEALGIREPWVTPQALRHHHATRMWEGGMRELALQKRLGHASPESTRIYTRVSDPSMVAEYNRALGKKDPGEEE